jgi:hypothetical protein
MDFSAQQIARVGVQGKRFYLEGDVVVPAPTAYRSRICDILNRDEEFLVLTNVSLYEDSRKDDAEPRYHEVLIIRKDQIQFTIPLD